MRLLALVAAGVMAVPVQSPPQPSGGGLPFRQSIAAGGLIYVSGTLAGDGSSAFPDGIGAQARATLERVDAVLRGAGASLHDAVSITVYLKRAEDFAAMNEVYKTFVGGAPAARTTVVAELMRPDALIEVTAVAAAPGTPRRVIHPSGWLRSPNPYSYAVEAGDTVFLSGLVARNAADNSPVPGDLASQTKTVLENARAVLTAAGLGFEHVVAARVFVTNIAEFDAMNAVYRTYFPKEPPARATVAARLTGPSYAVEMTLVASRAPKQVVAGDGPANPNLSPAIRAGSRLYVSGMLGVRADSKGDAAAQTRETLRRLEATIVRAGFTPADVVDSLVYLTRTADFAAMNGAYREVLHPPYPTRTTVQAALAAPEGLVEIMQTAVRR